MYGVFDERDFQPEGRRRDTELTLGPFMLLALLFGLVVLCGLCFGLGYSMGSHSSKASAPVTQQPAATTPFQTAGLHPKPPANSQSAPQRAVVNVEPEDSGASPAVQPGVPPTPAASNTGQWVVKPALPAQNTEARPLPAPAAMAIRGQSGGAPLMVQIAAVSHQQDAQVLVGALRKRGFAATLHRDPGDGLIHVQIGPFATRGEAGAMRQRLLNEGYNAMVQP